jgi:3-hydroxyisobutyrate dehydrogenase
MKERIGFIGLGIMGNPMAKNTLKAGFELVVYNRTREKMEELIALGAKPAASPRDVGERSDIVIIIVSDTPDVEEVIHGKYGLIEGLKPGTLIIDMSTISPSTEREIAKKLKEKGCSHIDAPVSGGEKGAIEGTLSIMVGGEEKNIERAMPVFLAMGKTVTHIGPTGSGQICKLANQIAVSLNNLAMSEALVFAAKAGVDTEKVRQAIAAGAGGSWAMSNLAPKVLKRDFSPGFMIRLQHKDLRIILDTARQMDLYLPGTSLAMDMYKSLLDKGLGGEGNHALVKALEILAGIEVRK